MKYPIKRHSQTFTIPDEGTDITANTSKALNGTLVGILLDVPALDGTTTLTITVKDADGYTLFSKASIAEGAKTSLILDGSLAMNIPISGILSVTLLASNAQTTAAVPIPVVFLVKQ